MFINLESADVYCLPEDYIVEDAALDDIKFALAPKFASVNIRGVDANTTLSNDIHGVPYLPGFVGMNNLGRTGSAMQISGLI